MKAEFYVIMLLCGASCESTYNNVSLVEKAVKTVSWGGMTQEYINCL